MNSSHHFVTPSMTSHIDFLQDVQQDRRTDRIHDPTGCTQNINDYQWNYAYCMVNLRHTETTSDRLGAENARLRCELHFLSCLLVTRHANV